MDAELTAPSSLPAGEVISGYRIVRTIGQGATGVVHEAVHEGLGKRVAFKTLHVQYLGAHDICRRFLYEGRAASQVRHPHIVDITDVGEFEGRPFLVMELLEGESLTAYRRRGGRLSAEQVTEIMLPVASAIAQAHQCGVIHRDLKPDNIFIARDLGEKLFPKVLDFGISKVLGDTSIATENHTAEHSFLGTPCYASPEQIQDVGAVSTRSDQYSFAVVLYELLSGQTPFGGHSSLFQILSAIHRGDCAPLSERCADVEPELAKVVERAMSQEPTSRYRCMNNLALALLPFASKSVRELWAPLFSPSLEAETRPSAICARAACTTEVALVQTISATQVSGARNDNNDADSSPALSEEFAPARRYRIVIAALGLAIIGYALVRLNSSPSYGPRVAPQTVIVAASPELETRLPPAEPNSSTLAEDSRALRRLEQPTPELDKARRQPQVKKAVAKARSLARSRRTVAPRKAPSPPSSAIGKPSPVTAVWKRSPPTQKSSWPVPRRDNVNPWEKKRR